MNVAEIISKLRESNVTPVADGEGLKLIGDVKSLEKEFIEEIRQEKNNLLSFIHGLHAMDFFQLEPIPYANDYPLSNAQKAIWMACQLEGANAAYNNVIGLSIKGDLDEQCLSEAFQLLIGRHEILRTNFFEIDSEPRQVILTNFHFDLERPDSVCAFNAEELNREIELYNHFEFNLKMDLLLKVKLIMLSAQEHVLVICIHHLISDGISIKNLVHELLANYGKLIKGSEVHNFPLLIQYKDITAWKNKIRSEQNNDAAKVFWAAELGSDISALDLQKDFSRQLVKSFGGGVAKFTIDAGYKSAIDKLCKQHHTTIFNFLRSVISILLGRFSNQENLIISTPVANRNHHVAENQVGLYINTLPLVCEIDQDLSFEEFFKNISAHTQKVLAFQDYDFDLILEEMPVNRNNIRKMLFDIVMVVHDVKNFESRVNDRFDHELEVGLLNEMTNFQSYLKLDEKRPSKFELCFTFFIQADNTILLEIEYSTSLYLKERIVHLFKSLLLIIGQAVEHPQHSIRSFDITTPEEQTKILNVYNTPIEGVKQTDFVQLYQASFIENINKTAIICPGTIMSFGDLDKSSSSIAEDLIERFNQVTNVGLLMGRSAQMVCCVFGVLKACKTYVPIDVGYPQKRIDYILDHAEIKLIIVDNAGKSVVPETYQGVVIHIDDFTNYKIVRKINSEKSVGLDANAYIIYTSGSTGQPKGVQVSHKNLLFFLQWAKKEFAGTAFEILYATTSYCFDISVFELLLPPLLGKTIRILPSALDINSWLSKDRHVFISTVPSVVRMMLEQGADWSNVKALNMAGEKIPIEIMEHLDPIAMEIRNLYGPTEDTVYSTVYRFSGEKKLLIPIGKPVDNTHAYILDDQYRLLPYGVSGELFLSGECLSKGYYNNAALTASSFVSNPFMPDRIMYRTGDIGRWRSDGQLEMIGRIDEQVKVRGYRVELAEIQFYLDKHILIKESVVLIKTVSGETDIVAYWTGDLGLKTAALKTYLAEFVPGFMIPAFFIRLEQMPLNSNGKIDRSRLPEPSENYRPATLSSLPQNELEANLLSLYKVVLNIDKLGTTDNFFDIGGHSLKAASLKMLISRELGIQVSFAEILTFPTVVKLATVIERSSRPEIREIPKLIGLDGKYPLSSAQNSIWLVSQLGEGGNAYNMFGAFTFQGVLDLDRWQHAFRELIARHEILRTVFRTDENGMIKQLVLPVTEVRFTLGFTHAEEWDNEDKLRNFIEKDSLHSFDLVTGPLLRANIYQKGPSSWILTFTIHHIICDGWSLNIITKELFGYYSGKCPKQLKLQYKDFAVWQQEQLNGPDLQHQKVYWLQQFAKELPVLNLPMAKIRPLLKTYNGGVVFAGLDEIITTKLRKACNDNGTTLYSGILSAINTLLFRYTNQTDIIIGCPVTDRDIDGLEEQVGVFLNMLALRVRFEGTDSFTEMLQHTKQSILAAFANKDFPFDQLVSSLSMIRDISRNPVFDVMVVLNEDKLKTSLKAEDFCDLKIDVFEAHVPPLAKFDLLFDFTEATDGLSFRIEYNKDIFDHDYIVGMAHHFEQILNGVLQNPDCPIELLNYLGEIERQKLILGFNDNFVDYSTESHVISLFEKQVLKYQDHLAVVSGQYQLTYQELNNSANQIAHYLVSRGVTTETIVPVILERGINMIIAILGILKAGAAYTPIDPEYPAERIAYILKDVNAGLVVTNNPDFSDCLHLYPVEILELGNQLISEQPIHNLHVDIRSNNLAYVIYTSGSTGKPKGVLNEHGGLLNRLLWTQDHYRLTTQDAVLQKTTYCFDVSVWELFWPLTAGARLVFAKPNGHKDIAYLKEAINFYNITLLHFVPSMLSVFLAETVYREFPGLKNVLCSGEALMLSQVKAFKEKLPDVKLYNLYGPTEAAIDVTSYLTGDSETSVIPIGKPISNTFLLILDKHVSLVPVGVAGEIYIGGIQVARGYLNLPDLTAERFIINPFVEDENLMLYKTGDLAKWLPDGNIEYLGRIDDQVKIRGVRIEIAEVETALQAHPQIETAVVKVWTNNNGEKSLAGYIVTKFKLPNNDIRSHLKNILPVHLMPTYMIHLDELPLSPNGKADRASLPEPRGEDIFSSTEYMAPRNETEEKLVAIWKLLLDTHQVGVKDNFFELGGHSLKIAQLLSRISIEFNVRISIQSVFNDPIIESITEQIIFLTDQRKKRLNKDQLMRIEI